MPKERLLCKLEGVGGKVLAWIREWLTGRRQKVRERMLGTVT